MSINNCNTNIGENNKNCVIYINQNIFSSPENVLKPLRELLKREQNREGFNYIYSQLGFAYLRLGEYKLSEMFYLQALEYNKNDVSSLANLAHASFELNKKNKAIYYGKLALQKKAELVSNKNEIADKPYNGSKNIIAFSLYGGIPKYCETAIINVEIIKSIFPDFTCRFYVNDTVPIEILDRLKNNGAEIKNIFKGRDELPGKFWRFLSLDDHNMNRVLIRDVDSILDQREAVCVNEWIESDKPFHIIRDSCSHTELILAGLFGVKAGVVRDIYHKLITFKETPGIDINHRFSDQIFLRNYIWPAIKKVALTHDSLYKFGECVLDIPENRTKKELSGDYINDHMGANYACRGLKVSINEEYKENSTLNFMLYDNSNILICKYKLLIPRQREVEILLPLHYLNNIENDLWHYQFEIN